MSENRTRVRGRRCGRRIEQVWNLKELGNKAHTSTTAGSTYRSYHVVLIHCSYPITNQFPITIYLCPHFFPNEILNKSFWWCCAKRREPAVKQSLVSFHGQSCNAVDLLRESKIHRNLTSQSNETTGRALSISSKTDRLGLQQWRWTWTEWIRRRLRTVLQ